MVYEEFAHCPKDTDGYKLVVTAFGIIGKESNLRPNAALPLLLMKQRNGDGEAPWCFDLPGGAADAADSDVREDGSLDGIHDRVHRKTLQRELWEEVGIRSAFHFRIGKPLWEVRQCEKKVVEYHLFLAVPFGPPKESEEALNIAWVNPRSAFGLKIAGLDEEKQTMSPMGVMLYDGFSVLAKPMYDGPVTQEILSLTDTRLTTIDYCPLNGGRYFGRIANTGNVRIYRRLNPFMPRGYFVGDLECLANS